MNQTVLFQLCDGFASLTGIPVTILADERIRYQTGAVNRNMQIPFPAELSSGSLQNLPLENGITASCFRTEDGLILLAGPAFTRHMTEEEKQKALKTLRFSGDSSLFPVLSSPRFQEAAGFLFLSVNHSLAIPAESASRETASRSLYIEKKEADWAAYNDEYTEKMCFYVENGDVEGLRQLMKNEQPAPYGELSRDRLRHWKNSCFALLYMIRRAAEKSGVDPVSSLHLAEQYSRKMDEAADIGSLTEISRIMRLDYCTRVRECLVPKDLSVTVQNALRTIRIHCHEHLTIADIAAMTGISPAYLCFIVKKETGSTVNAWVQKEKIRAAKELLRFTDHTILNIAESLSYSSQSHFQTTFRKYTGMTPLQYRNLR